jgi:hypothetical protein
MALSIDDGDAETLARAALISAFMVGDCESEIELANRAVALNPNFGGDGGLEVIALNSDHRLLSKR